MFYTYFSSRGVDIAAYTSAPRGAGMIAHDAPTFETVSEAEAWIANVGNKKAQALRGE